ncbi:MAG: YcbK family protein, partial [Candidatus Binatia bacterium]
MRPVSVAQSSRIQPPCSAPDESPAQSRFFFSGDGTIDLYNAHFPERLTVRYRRADGSYDDAALAQVDRFFRSRTDGRQGPVSLRLIELIDFVQDRYRPTRLTLVSGYRSSAMNAALRAAGGRVAEASLHTEGMAADLQPQGLDLRTLWKQLRALELGGVGFYRADGFLHLDTGKPRFWEAATSGTDKNLSKENARLFARTEFDRYAALDGAQIRLHAVTALPIRIARTAHLGELALPLQPLDPAVALEGDCWLLAAPAARYA